MKVGAIAVPEPPSGVVPVIAPGSVAAWEIDVIDPRRAPRR